MTEELISEIQLRINEINEDVDSLNSTMIYVTLGLKQAQDIIKRWEEIYND